MAIDITNESFDFIIFGATGDLTHRKLLPAFYNLYRQGQLPDNLNIYAIGRRDKNDQIYREEARNAVIEHSRFDFKEDSWDEFAAKIKYLKFDISQDEGYQVLKQEFNENYRQIYYLAVSPDYFSLIVDKLDEHDMLKNREKNSRLVIEKPFGHNLESAINLNEKISSVFPEEDIYRIDHYLGKEMLQNIMVLRFANSIFEAIWNNKFIDNIQIISNELGGVGDRGGYYDQSGALRDMLQNHILQLLSLTAMEAPGSMDNEAVRNEKVKVLKALEIEDDKLEDYTVRGQYDSGMIDGEQVVSYRGESRTADESNTETFVAVKTFINNLRWADVPFYLKTGKRTTRKSTEVIVEFKEAAHPAYQSKVSSLMPNLLVIRIQPQEGVFFQFNAKHPGTDTKIVPVQMDFCQNCQLGENSPEAYERLLFEVMKGDSTLFTRWDEVEYSWRFVDKIAKLWQEKEPEFPNYKAGSNGPKEANELLERDGRKWWDINDLAAEDGII
ncbi:glucose-6-phosphate dehydrogenase [Natronospora cellulosivora (SeqCode)]